LIDYRWSKNETE